MCPRTADAHRPHNAVHQRDNTDRQRDGAPNVRLASGADEGSARHGRINSASPSPADLPVGVTVHAVADPWAGKKPVIADYDPRVRGSRVRKWLREFVFPDRFVRWQRDAFRAGAEAVRRQRPDVILASFPPASA